MTRPSVSVWSRPWNTPLSPASKKAAPVAKVAAKKIKFLSVWTSDLWSRSGFACQNEIDHGAQPLLLYSPREVYPNWLYQSPALLCFLFCFFCLKPVSSSHSSVFDFTLNLIWCNRNFIYLPVWFVAPQCTLLELFFVFFCLIFFLLLFFVILKFIIHLCPLFSKISQVDDKVGFGYGTALLLLVTLYINQLCTVSVKINYWGHMSTYISVRWGGGFCHWSCNFCSYTRFLNKSEYCVSANCWLFFVCVQ